MVLSYPSTCYMPFVRDGQWSALSWLLIPQIGGWLLIWGATSLHHLYIARAITGVGIGAGVPIASIYMRWVALVVHSNLFFFREISTPKLRGTLVILMPAAANTGQYLFIKTQIMKPFFQYIQPQSTRRNTYLVHLNQCFGHQQTSRGEFG